MKKKLEELPKSENEFWEHAEKYVSKAKPLPSCETHKQENWKDHVGYMDNHDGTSSCKYCSWGFIVPGYMRIHEGRVFDLRTA